MRIHKITEEEVDYICAICLDPSIGKKMRKTMQSGMTDRISWIKEMMHKGLEIFVALEEPKQEKIKYKWAGEMLHSDLAVHGWVPKGLLESVPIEFALEPVKGKSLLFINCIWVLPPFWNTGVATRLMESFIQSVKIQKFKGASVLAYDGDNWFGTSIKYLPVDFFKKFGFKEITREGSRVLLFLDLGSKDPPSLIFPRKKSYHKNDKIIIDVLFNSQCPWSGFMMNDIKNNLRKNSQVTINTINTDDRRKIEEFGMSRGIYINGKPIIKRMAPWNEIRTEIQKI